MDNKLFIPDEHGFFDDLVVMLVSLSSYMFTMHVSMASNTPVPLGERPLKEWISYIVPLKIIDWPFAMGCRATESNLVVFPIPAVMICSLDAVSYTHLGLVRLSVGIEHADDLIADLKRALL